MFDLFPSRSPRLTVHLLPHAEGLTVRATDPAGHSAEAHTVLQRAEDVLRMASQPGFHEDVGRGLFRTLLPGELDELYRAAYTQATVSGARLALDLHFDGSLVRLARYPWELLHDGTRFLLRGGTVSLTRVFGFPAPVPPYEPRGPLEILTAAPQPDGQPALAPVAGALAEALDDALRADVVDVGQLFPATWDALLEWLFSGGPDVLHFEGHGDFTRTGRLFFEDARGGVDAVAAEDIGAAFYSTALRMVALSASEASGAGAESALSSIAPVLVAAGVPVVVATQYTLPQAEATRFWRVLYAALLAGEDVESAVAAGRHALRRTPHWHAIALYRRAVHGPAPDAAPVPACVDTAAPKFTLTGWTVRAGVWLRPVDAPATDAGTVAHVIGAPLASDAQPAATAAPAAGDAPLFVARPGPVTVRIAAPGCEVHHAAERVLPFVREGSPVPVWFAVTPREPGVRALTFTLQQEDRTLAAVTHLLRVDPPDDAVYGEDEVALLQSHGCGRARAAAPAASGALGAASREPDRSEGAADAAGRDTRESRDRPAPGAGATPRHSPREAAPFDEALDGVQDMLQAGLPPDGDDDPLVHAPVASLRRLDDRSGALLDALPETESLRALAARGPLPAAGTPESAPGPAQSPAMHHAAPPVDDARPQRWWLLLVAAILMGLVFVLLVT